MPPSLPPATPPAPQYVPIQQLPLPSPPPPLRPPCGWADGLVLLPPQQDEFTDLVAEEGNSYIWCYDLRLYPEYCERAYVYFEQEERYSRCHYNEGKCTAAAERLACPSPPPLPRPPPAPPKPSFDA